MLISILITLAIGGIYLFSVWRQRQIPGVIEQQIANQRPDLDKLAVMRAFFPAHLRGKRRTITVGRANDEGRRRIGVWQLRGEGPEGAPRPQPSYRGDHHHRGKTGCGLQAQQGTDGKAGAARDPSDAGSGPMMPPEKSRRDGGGSWLR